MKELQSLSLDVRVQDSDGNIIDIKQNYDEDDMGFDGADLAIGDDVMIESELENDYNIEDADEIDADFEEPEEPDEGFEDDVFAVLETDDL